jgi:single-stranded-DNA-specific exonuclease
LPHDQQAVHHLASKLRLSPVVAQLLLNRGLTAPEQARRFLDAPLSGLHPPELLPGISEASRRILNAVEQGRKVCVYGDYDVDGVSGSAILLRCLRLLGAQPDVYVPHRLEEGYGLNRGALEQIAASGVSLVVTVDCGIASHAEAEAARALGLELVVTDHHEMKETLPPADVIVHPRLPGGNYPFGQLSGSAVAFKLAWALAQRRCGSEKVTPLFRDFLLDAVALAALGVVADVVPLVDENRIIVRYGLHRLRQSPPAGLLALCEVAGYSSTAELKASDIGYRIAPRINAVGRLGKALQAVELLTTTRREQAADLARYLEQLNAERQQIEREMTQQAREQIERDGLGSRPALVVASQGWHAGVIGIVAGRLVEQYGRPALMITLPGGEVGSGEDPLRALRAGMRARLGIGSARSVPGFPMHLALAACSEVLVSHGGHHAAAGFKLEPEKLELFREKFYAFAAGHFKGATQAPGLVLDAETPLNVLTPGLVKDLDQLEPYGAHNRKPLFLAADLQVTGEPRKVGVGERHLSFRVRQGGATLKAIGWNMAERMAELLSGGGACCLAFTPKINEWQGRKSIDLEVTDFQPGRAVRLG